MNKLLITGALGHIGSRFIHDLLPGQFETVTLMDDLSSERYCSLFNLPRAVNFSFVEKCILSDSLDRLIGDSDIVIHLAAITDATSSFKRQAEIEEVNFVGTKKVAESCARNNTTLIFPSTTSVYGSQANVVDETCPELFPQSPYADTKLRSEKCLIELASKHDLRFVTCRFGTIFGPSIGMRFHTAVNKFCWQAVVGQPLTIWSTAFDQKRPYLGVGDASRAIHHIIDQDLFDGQTYNILSSNNTVKEILQIIRRSIPSVEVALTDSEIMNQLSYSVRGDKFQNTDFRSIDKLDTGITQTLELIRI